MCILTVAANAHPDYPLVIAHNRDEYFARTAAPLAMRGDILCATDAASGGTWMGLNVRSGAVAALTNVRCAPRAGSRSRGELVLRVLRGDKAAAASDEYANYNLLHAVLTADGPVDLSLSTW